MYVIKTVMGFLSPMSSVTVLRALNDPVLITGILRMTVSVRSSYWTCRMIWIRRMWLSWWVWISLMLFLTIMDMCRCVIAVGTFCRSSVTTMLDAGVLTTLERPLRTPSHTLRMCHLSNAMLIRWTIERSTSNFFIKLYIFIFFEIKYHFLKFN